MFGEDILFDSTLNSNNRFKETFISLTSQDVFDTLQKNIDLLIEMQENLSLLYSSLENDRLTENIVQKISREIENQKSKVKELFLNTQRLILTSYFDNSINLAYAPKQLENYRNKLYLFKNIIAYAEGDNFYNDYYIDKMMQIEKIYDYNPMEDTFLTVIKHSFLSTLIQKLKLLFGLGKEYEIGK